MLVVEHLAYRELLVRKGRKRPLSLWQIGLQDTALGLCMPLRLPVHVLAFTGVRVLKAASIDDGRWSRNAGGWSTAG